PQPQQQQAISGYISNGTTWIARVTFSNGLTRGGEQSPLFKQQRSSPLLVDWHLSLNNLECREDVGQHSS
ncbi:MAG TPA: hypothetical protein VJO16_07145, partial [Candidatus Acidoferrum sp.]|nr:hypothetical protein [Candidatus Acidoferrum sp.]